MKLSVTAVENYDERVFYYFNNCIKCPVFDYLMPRITNLGGAFFTIALCVILYLFENHAGKSSAKEAMAALLLSHLIVQVFKRFVRRRRPYLNYSNVNTFTRIWKDYSFPSGHTAAAFSLATIFVRTIPPVAFICFILAFLVGISRIYIGMHYPSDVIIGALIGTIFAIAVCSY